VNKRFFLLAIVFTMTLSLVAQKSNDFATNKDAKIYVAGHNGLVGSAIVRKLCSEGYCNITTKASIELDLKNQSAVDEFFAKEQPEYVFVAAAKVGGIIANQASPADFLYENLMIEANVIHAAHKYAVKKLLFLGSSCIYPRDCLQPIKEEYLLSGPLEESNIGYALAKISGLMLCKKYRQQYNDDFISCMPTNLYGPGDNFDLQSSHVLPALMSKMHAAKENAEATVVVWGTGAPYREFLHVEDCANACIFLMKAYSGDVTVNVGTGEDLTIKELAQMVKEVVGYKGELIFDSSKPDGTPKKLLDVSKLRDLGWKHSIELRKGMAETYKWFLAHQKLLRKVCL